MRLPPPLAQPAAAPAAWTSGRWSTAAQQWTRVVDGNPVNGNHWHQLASAHFSLGDFAAALPAYEKARELGVWRSRDLAGPSDLVFPADIEYKIGCCHAQLDQLEQATAALEAQLQVLTNASRDAVRRGRDALVSSGWLVKVAGARQNYAARYRLTALDNRRAGRTALPAPYGPC